MPPRARLREVGEIPEKVSKAVAAALGDAPTPRSRCSTSAWPAGGTTSSTGWPAPTRPPSSTTSRRGWSTLAATAYAERSPELKRLDLRRLLEPDWFQHPRMLGYAAYADRFGGDLRGVGEHVAVPRRARRHVPPPDAAAAAAAGPERRRLRRRRLPHRAPGPRHGRRPARAGHAAAGARHQPVPRPRAQPRRPRARVGRGGAGRRSDVPPVLPHPPRPHRARRLRADAARGVPRLRARQLHVGRRRRRLGLDDVQLVAVGPRLVEPRRRVRVRRHHPVPRQPRRRGPPARRHRVHLEAPRHDVPEPARGPRHHPGAAGRHPDGRAGRGVQGRGDRGAGRRRALPRAGSPPRQGQRPRLPQQPDGPDLVDAGDAATCGCRCTCCGRSARSRRARRGSRTSAATTTSAGPSTTPTPPPSGCPARPTGGSSPTTTPGEFWQSPARGVVFQANEATGDRRISGTLASLAGLDDAARARATTTRCGWPSGASC